MDRRIHLKVKIKSLAEEARIIRKEERKLKGQISRTSSEYPEDIKEKRDQVINLVHHRKGVVGHEARHTHLAYAIFRGTPYHKLELKCREKPIFRKIKEMAHRFGASEEDVTNWVDDARNHLKMYVAPEEVAPPENPKPLAKRSIFKLFA